MCPATNFNHWVKNQEEKKSHYPINLYNAIERQHPKDLESTPFSVAFI